MCYGFLVNFHISSFARLVYAQATTSILHRIVLREFWPYEQLMTTGHRILRNRNNLKTIVQIHDI